MKEHIYIDLFSGAGGLSEGFRQTGFIPITHVESVPEACRTLKTREGYYFHSSNNSLSIYNDYIKGDLSQLDFYNGIFGNEEASMILNEEIGAKSKSKIFDTIDNKLKGREVDVVIGGPPCQAYSIIGRSRIGKEKIKNDPRLNLYKQYNKFLAKYQPKYFVFENVRGLLSIDKGKFYERIRNSFVRQGYDVIVFEVNSKDFGVLQDRRRLIIVGSHKELKHKELISLEDLTTGSVSRAKIKYIFNDLPKIVPGQNLDVIRYTKQYTNKYLVESGIRNGVNFTTQHFARPHNPRDREIYRHVINEWNTNKRRLKYCDLPDALITHKNKTGFLDRYKVVAGDLDISQTVVAHLSKDGHYFIHPDINQCRSITVREAARLQSFPDNYYFEGSRTSIFRQIGNAVPPLMAKGIAKAIKEKL